MDAIKKSGADCEKACKLLINHKLLANEHTTDDPFKASYEQNLQKR